jgi:hypothetical protein
VQKEIRYIFQIVKKWAPGIAVQAFLSVCDDTIMLDRWIPDEDWVRQIREIGEDDRCSMTNLNIMYAGRAVVGMPDHRLLFYYFLVRSPGLIDRER